MRVFAVISLFFLFGVSISAQPKVIETLKKIDASLPSIFVSLEKKEMNLSPQTKVPFEVAWFRLHNNLPTKIRFCVYDKSISRTGSPGVYYEIEKQWNVLNKAAPQPPVIVSAFPANDLCTAYELEPGNSFYFGIPAIEFVDNSRLKIRFNFPWESDRDVFLGNEAEHFAYFYSEKLKQ